MRRLPALAALLLVAVLASGCATGFVGRPTDITATSATVNGIVWTTDGGQVSYWVEYGTTTAYDRETPHQTANVADDTPHAVSIPLTGLTPATSWHYRICAKDAGAGTCSKDATLFTGDSVAGLATECPDDEGEFCVHRTFVSVDARSGPSGQNPSGQAEWERHVGTGVDIGDQGPVSCLAVTGNVAIIGIESEFALTLIRVADGGAAPGQDSFSATTQFNSISGPSPPPPSCSSYPPPPFGNINWTGSGTNDRGDLVVTDVDPPSTSNNQ